jgi:DsbC/DsbD-like thiol-disulfide interchange protein
MSILKFKYLSLPFYLFLILFFFSGQVRSQSISAAKARIISNSYSTEKDSVIQIGVLIELANDWHIYWKNPGDSGMPTSIKWDIPTEFQITQFQWPIPKSFEFEGLVSYGYEDHVLFITDIFLPNNDKTQIINISANIKSLLCKDICIPYDTIINFTIDIRKVYSTDETVRKLFEQTKKTLPTKANSRGLWARSNSGQISLRIDKSSDYFLQNGSMNFIPYENGLFKNSLRQNIVQEKEYLEIVLEADPFRTKDPKELYGLLVSKSNNDGAIASKAFEIKIPISD